MSIGGVAGLTFPPPPPHGPILKKSPRERENKKKTTKTKMPAKTRTKVRAGLFGAFFFYFLGNPPIVQPTRADEMWDDRLESGGGGHTEGKIGKMRGGGVDPGRACKRD